MTGVTVEQALKNARQLHREGRLADAQALYRAVLAQWPNHPEALQSDFLYPFPQFLRLIRQMNAIRHFVLLVIALVCIPRTQAADSVAAREWTIDGVKREALVYIPANAKSAPAPVIFAFHGHGGTMAFAERKFSYHTLWPEAVVVYPQGLPTAGKLIDREGRQAGWQFAAGDYGDRDLKFFDAMLATLRQELRVDDKRIYVTGHSNGGGFTYLLWAKRGDQIAAAGPCAAAALQLAGQLKPKPVFHLAGENDPIVKFEWQKMTIDNVLKVDQCGSGEPWAEHCTFYPSKIGAPVVTYIHSGHHEVPPDAPALIVKFFKQQTLNPAGAVSR